jgi:CelD/BcsL family acetyltransferase involved in cellulose biosynthesis
MTGVTILPIDDPRWHAFVTAHQRALPFHQPGWARLVADCYGFRPFAAAVEDGAGTISAGLPIVEVRHLLGRRRWVALPFTDYCPPLASDDAGERALAEMLRRAAREAGVASVEVRASLEGGTPLPEPALRHVLELDADPMVVYRGFHPSQVQRSIRRAERQGLRVRRSVEPEDLLRTFYELHLRTRRRQGVPIQPRRFFRLLAARLMAHGQGWVDIVEAAGRPIAAALFLAGNGTVIYKFGASDESAWPMRPNHLLFWHAIRAACEDGYRTFDFGRTDAGHDSLAAFKRSWGAREEQLTYSILGPAVPAQAGHGVAARVLGHAIRHTPSFVCRAAGELHYRNVA